MNSRQLLVLFIFLFSSSIQAGAITCEDAISVKSKEAKKELHRLAQQRAQKNVERLVGKQLINPYINGGISDSPRTLETTIPFIEIFWCNTPSMPLHSAYYNLYTSDHTGVLKFFNK